MLGFSICEISGGFYRSKFTHLQVYQEELNKVGYISLTIRMKFTRSTVAVMRSSCQTYIAMIIRVRAQVATSQATVT
jgi:hypothetical protein